MNEVTQVITFLLQTLQQKDETIRLLNERVRQLTPPPTPPSETKPE